MSGLHLAISLQLGISLASAFDRVVPSPATGRRILFDHYAHQSSGYHSREVAGLHTRHREGAHHMDLSLEDTEGVPDWGLSIPLEGKGVHQMATKNCCG